MKVRGLWVVLALLALAAWQVPAVAQDVPPWREAVVRMSKVQALLEYFYMETGEYPPNLAVLERSFNHALPDKAPKVVVPLDPASSKPFVYELSQDGRRYRLAPPEPDKYGANAVVLDSIDWAWMAVLARQRRAEQLALECKYNMEVLATQSEMFAKDNGGKFPSQVDELVPKYIPRHPTCPLSGKNYTYAPGGKGYFISCPNPPNHGLRKFGYSSDRGMVVEPLEGRAPAGQAPAPGASPAAPGK